MPEPTLPVAVLGGGVIGLCVASQLQKEGHQVILIDRGDPRAASFGNAGCINGSSIIPNSSHDVLSRIPKWLLDEEGPLVLRPTYLPRALPWLLRFIASGTPEKVAVQARALRELLLPSVENFRKLANDAGLEDLLHIRGHLITYSTESGFIADSSAMALREQHGVKVEVLSRDELNDREPNLSADFTRARYIGETGHLDDPGQFLQGLARYAKSRGAMFLSAKVTGLQTNGKQVTAVSTTAGAVDVKAVVIALGAWSKECVKMLGDRVLLDTERGYHIEVPGSSAGPSVPTLWAESKIFATPMNGRVRCAGTVEFAGLQAPPNWKRCDLLERQLRRMYPKIEADLDQTPPTDGSRWLGFRPSTPDSLPVIGPASKFSNAIYAFGHGHVGLTAGASTGQIVAQLVAGVQPHIDISPFSIRRFS